MPSAVKPPQTLYDKVFEDHIVEEKEDGTVLLYIGRFLESPDVAIFADKPADRHLVHEVTSPVRLPSEHAPRGIIADNQRSKLSKAFAMPTAGLGDQTARWLQSIT